jgi:hypothetical protein
MRCSSQVAVDTKQLIRNDQHSPVFSTILVKCYQSTLISSTSSKQGTFPFCSVSFSFFFCLLSLPCHTISSFLIPAYIIQWIVLNPNNVELRSTMYIWAGEVLKEIMVVPTIPQLPHPAPSPVMPLQTTTTTTQVTTNHQLTISSYKNHQQLVQPPLLQIQRTSQTCSEKMK